VIGLRDQLSQANSSLKSTPLPLNYHYKTRSGGLNVAKSREVMIFDSQKLAVLRMTEKEDEIREVLKYMSAHAKPKFPTLTEIALLLFFRPISTSRVRHATAGRSVLKR
jgi:hypothetical protein